MPPEQNQASSINSNPVTPNPAITSASPTPPPVTPEKHKNAPLLIGIIVVLLIVLGYVIFKQKTTTVVLAPSPDAVENEAVYVEESVEENAYVIPDGWILENDTKFGFQFAHDPAHALQGTNTATYSVDAAGSGREYRCPLSNNTTRVYSEKEVAETGVNISGCTYVGPDIQGVIDSESTAAWSQGVYGSTPTVHDVLVGSISAKLVYGSTATRTLIVPLATPYEQNGYKYDFLRIQADEGLMNDILVSFKLTR